jgi:hypothetical protein
MATLSRGFFIDLTFRVVLFSESRLNICHILFSPELWTKTSPENGSNCPYCQSDTINGLAKWC